MCIYLNYCVDPIEYITNLLMSPSARLGTIYLKSSDQKSREATSVVWYPKLLDNYDFKIPSKMGCLEAVKVLASAIWGRKFEVVWSKNVINIFFMNCCKDQNLKLWAKSVHIYRSYGHFQKCGQFPKRIYYINFERWCASDFWWNFKSKVFQGLGVPSYTCGFMWFLIWWF